MKSERFCQNSKMGRRKKKIIKDDSFDEELAIEIYGKQKYEAPVNEGLETIFDEEDPRRPRASKAKLQPKLRMVTSNPYFLEDTEKDTLRKKQVGKLFKGRKKIKWKGLTTKQEEKLLKTIADKSDTEEDTDIELEQNDAVQDEIASRATEEIASQAVDATIQKGENNEIDENIKDADAFLGPLGFGDDENDSSFKSNLGKENTKLISNDRRKSTISKVRRSSRFFRCPNLPLTDQTNTLGSVYQDVEIEDRRASRRSRLFPGPKVSELESSLQLTNLE